MPTLDIESSAPRAAPGRRVVAVAFVVLAALLVLTTHWESPLAAANARVDPSYMQATGMALAQRLRFGVDVLFTFGPLGWFNTSPHVDGLYWTKFAWELVVRGALVVLLVLLAARLERRWERVLFVLALIAPAMRSDSWWFAAAFALTVWDTRAERASTVRETCAALGWTLIGLVKFTFLLFAVLCAAAAIASAWSTRSRRDALRFAAIALGVFTASWMALGQSPLDFPAFVAWSVELTRGYSAGMSIPIDASALAWAVAGGVACVLVLALHVRTHGRDVRTMALGALFALGTFLAFKAGYVRNFGAILFFGYVGVAPYLLAFAMPAPARSGTALAFARTFAFVVATLGNMGTGIGLANPREVWNSLAQRITEHARDMAGPRELEQRVLAQTREREKLFALPRTRALVGERGVEVFGGEHAVLALNHLAWRPRLCPFAFSVLTERMAERNARDLAAPDAAEFVLLRGGGTADGRLPTSEDGLALRTVLRDYAPVLTEGGFLVFERRADSPRRSEERELLRRRVRFGESLDLTAFEGKCLVLRVDVRPSALGSLRTTLFQAATLMAHVELTDGYANDFRVVPELARTGTIVAPFLLDHDAWMRWTIGKPVARVARITLLPPEDASLWDADCEVVLTREDALAPLLAPEQQRAFEWALFGTPPRAVESDVPVRRDFFLWRDEVLVVGAPSRLVYDLAPGRTHVSARFGWLREALFQGSTDGAICRAVARVPGAEPRVVFERVLDPLENMADRMLLELEVDVDSEHAGELTLEFDPGPARDARGDATFWTGVTLTPR